MRKYATRKGEGRLSKKEYYDPEIETMPLSKLGEIQEKRLKAAVRYHYQNSRLFREKLKREGIKPQSILKLSDLSKLPFITREDLSKTKEALSAPIGEITRVRSTSGTTGEPIRAFLTKTDQENLLDLDCRGFYCSGVREGDIAQIIFPPDWTPRTQKSLMKLKAFAIGTGIGYTQRQVTALNMLKTTVMIGTPSYILHMARVAEEMGIDPRGTSLRIAIFGGERLAPVTRKKIEDAWNVDTRDQYGSVELMIAFKECQEKNGFHIHADHFIFEIVDPKTGESLEDDENGELVVTTLTREGMPLIRYRMRDVTHLIYDECNCGRTHPRIGPIKGRLDDMAKIKGTSVFPSQVENVIMGIAGVNNYQAVITKRGILDTLILKIEAKEPSERLIQEIKEEVKAATRITPEVEFVELGSLMGERKTKHFIDLRKPPIESEH